MNYAIRDRLMALGFSEDVAMQHMRFMEMWEATLDPDEHVFLVMKGAGDHSYLTSTATPSLEGETPCLVFEIGGEEG